MSEKICNVCHINKQIQDYPKNGRIYRANCKSCHSQKQMERYSINNESINNRRRKRYKELTDMEKNIILQKNKEYYINNHEKILDNKNKYYQKNRDEILHKLKQTDYKEKRNKYLQNKRKTDKKFNMICAYRARLNEVLHKQKKNTYIHYLDCNREMFLNWIEFQFNDEFSWCDYGNKWVIDHVIPIDFFDLNIHEHRKRCFNWYNLRPCEINANLTKSNQIILNLVETHQNIIENYIKINGYQVNIEIYLWLRNELRYGKNSSVLGNPQPSS